MAVRWSWACVTLHDGMNGAFALAGRDFDTQEQVRADLQKHLDAGLGGPTETIAADVLRQAAWAGDELMVVCPPVAAWIAFAIPEGQSSEQAIRFLVRDKQDELRQRLLVDRENWATKNSGCAVAGVLSLAGLSALGMWAQSPWGL
ncbi:hypothetical protein NLX83_39275 [Allokutzneria sp. A3M-2-11 16]|uniref:hypothetical protein n=1 Tax=Allokutzneria sp. A3M-2-11 16 TaxID=2962043 RepID=UPI0020B6F0FF|nr:hypothetical protein [Allokutzneria sp. A3M-2-11 16]MCP3805325.1 hypothetical protein [Allokutzneria sp. A3M-2-11 16]